MPTRGFSSRDSDSGAGPHSRSKHAQSQGEAVSAQATDGGKRALFEGSHHVCTETGKSGAIPWWLGASQHRGPEKVRGLVHLPRVFFSMALNCAASPRTLSDAAPKLATTHALHEAMVEGEMAHTNREAALSKQQGGEQ